MQELHRLHTRHRRSLRRIGALLGLGLAGTLLMLPRADAQMAPASLYLTPSLVSTAAFGTFYGLPHP